MATAQGWKDDAKDLFLRRKSLLVPLGGAMLVLVGLGYQLIGNSQEKGEIVEIIPAEERVLGDDMAQDVIWIDVAGAVEKPGVYELAEGSRVNDALVAAGGLNLRADRSWVGRYLNRAQMLGDGVKIYVPEVGESVSSATLEESQAGHLPAAQQAVQGVTLKVSINMGSKTELDSLWGIGEIRAEAIISNRPYQSIEELKTKANIPQNVIDRNRDKVSL